MQSHKGSFHPYCDLLRKPNQLLNDLGSEETKEILYLWNFIHQQRDILDIENAPKMNEDSDETEDENEIIKKEDKKRLHLDTTFKSVMVYVYHSSFNYNSLAIRLCSLMFYHYFSCSQECSLEYPVQVMQAIPVNRYTIPLIFYLTTSNNDFLQYNEIGDIPHLLLVKNINVLIKDYLISPLGQQTSKKTPGSIYMRTRVLGSDHKGFVYYLLNGFLISNANGKWFIFHSSGQIDDFVETLNNDQPDTDLSIQINNFRKYIKTDRKVAQEFAVSKKGITPASHYITFSPIKNHCEFDNETKNMIQSAIKDICWILMKIEKLAQLERINQLDSFKQLNEVNVITNQNVQQPMEEIFENNHSENRMVVEEENKTDSGEQEMSYSEENDKQQETKKYNKSNDSIQSSASSISEGNSENEESSSEQEGESKEIITPPSSGPLSKNKPKKRAKIRIGKEKLNKKKQEFFDKAYLNEIQTINQSELNEMIDQYSEQLALLPLLNSKNYKQIIHQVIDIISTLVSILPNKYFRREYIFVRDFITGLSTKTSSLSFLIVTTTLLDKAIIKCN
ncbi:hypothetical protein ENUP19_0079G0025 [Entamoeba nuttalli]|uniref:Uncharacterized protein n=2 Tax=Entamoeba nuttalli TaxID=412467 RepID=K2H4Q6_ENTNP|nr:hypothetical protein ENU1_059890 [Entamoeba nuttalli P19]EKE41322.1 hypothetical protein ENU1_059890 [Entamoeba nuttalli P19]|eukprot:XP_008856342.1 hypothetical protein ENU1_059890 [Entamoeba nuttalli P19]